MVKFIGGAVKDELINKLLNTITFGDNVLIDWIIKLIIGAIIYRILYKLVFNFVGKIYKTGIIRGKTIGSLLYWFIMSIILLFAIGLTYLIIILIQNIKIIILVIIISLVLLLLVDLFKSRLQKKLN